MPPAEFLRQKAREVRALIALAKVPEVRAQLRLWVRELEREAAHVEATAATTPHTSTAGRRPPRGKGRRRAS
jgi:hypothetical protein